MDSRYSFFSGLISLKAREGERRKIDPEKGGRTKRKSLPGNNPPLKDRPGWIRGGMGSGLFAV